MTEVVQAADGCSPCAKIARPDADRCKTLPLASPGGAPTGLVVSGMCAHASFLNGVYELGGIAAGTGRPWYAREGTGYALFFDSDCDGGGSVPRWLFGSGEKDWSRSEDLDGDGGCNYRARIDSAAVLPPRGDLTDP